MERFNVLPNLTQEETLEFQQLMEVMGECRDADPGLFFAEPKDVEKIKQAKAICAQCIGAWLCLKYALANNELGVWGGKSEAERQTILLRRQYADQPAGSPVDPGS